MSVIRLISGATITIDEKADLPDMERAATHFFQKTHGRRETYTIHRGCIIVRCTPRGMTRQTSVYLFGISSESGKKTFFNTAGCNVDGIDQAKKLIDIILKQGWCNYGLKPFDKTKFLIVHEGGSYFVESTVDEIEEKKGQVVRERRAKVFNLVENKEMVWTGSGKPEWLEIENKKI